MDFHAKYNRSEKGHKRYLSYYYKNAAAINYGRYKRKLVERISIKQRKIAELERMLQDVQEI